MFEMQKTTRWISVIAALLLTGCTDYWRNPGQWQQRYATDSAFCQKQASQGPRGEEVFRQCMESRGWPQEQR